MGISLYIKHGLVQRGVVRWRMQNQELLEQQKSFSSLGRRRFLKNITTYKYLKYNKHLFLTKVCLKEPRRCSLHELYMYLKLTDNV